MACRTLLRRYPDFPDTRAALAAAEWELGQLERAEGDWNRVEDPRWCPVSMHSGMLHAPPGRPCRMGM